MPSTNRDDRLDAMRRYGRSPKGRAADKRRSGTPERLAWRRANYAKKMLDPEWAANKRRLTLAAMKRFMQTPKGRAYHVNYEIGRERRKVGNGGSHTVQEWREKVELHAGCCIYCGESKPLTRDHNIPISRGGSDDIANILPACASCNARKRNLTAREYLAKKAA